MASKVKEAFMGDKGLSGVVRKAPLEKVFEIKNVKQVRTGRSRWARHATSSLFASCIGPMLSLRPCVKQVCRYADGYQPHLVSPEKGIRALGVEALDQVEGPVKSCVQAVYTLLVNAARCAAREGVDCRGGQPHLSG